MNYFPEASPVPPVGGDAAMPCSVAAVIVGYNARHLLRACLGSLLAIEHPKLLVIYVDNASTDGSLDFVKATFPSVVAIASGGNLGYCGGNNVGIEHALGLGAEFVLIQNPDTSVYNPAYVAKMVAYLKEHPTVGAAGPLVYLREPGQIQNTILNWPSIFGSISAVLSGAPVDGVGGRSAATHAATEVPVLNGCCFLVRSQALREVGLYDPEFWTYVEEVDWSWRAEQHGWKRHFLPIESIVHHQKKDGYERGSRTEFFMKRNTALWFLKAGRIGSMLAWMVFTLVSAALRVALALPRPQSLPVHAQFVAKLAREYATVVFRLTPRLRSLDLRVTPSGPQSLHRQPRDPS